jgi:hypothetical protein
MAGQVGQGKAGRQAGRGGPASGAEWGRQAGERSRSAGWTRQDEAAGQEGRRGA